MCPGLPLLTKWRPGIGLNPDQNTLYAKERQVLFCSYMTKAISSLTTLSVSQSVSQRSASPY